MTEAEILMDLKDRYGNDWPLAALRMLFDLVSVPSHRRTKAEEEKRCVLRDWVQRMIEAGVAFLQTQDQ